MAGAAQSLSDAWYSEAWWLWLLRPAEVLFRMLAAARRCCYRFGLCRTYKPPVPLVVVGNITVGGTGKTPVVIALVEALAALGLRAGVVSRGYGATAKHFPHVLDEHSVLADCGDEPLLIYRRTGCPCVVSPDRVQAVRTLLSLFTVDIVLSDDGLQHYALDRDMEIALLDADARLGNGFCLPAGPLREPPGRLDTVDYVLYRGSDDPDSGVQYDADALVNVRTGDRVAPSPGRLGARVSAVAGIGQPRQFFTALETLGFTLRQRVFPDHHVFTAADFHGLEDRPIIMTEKDAVKCRDIAGSNTWYLSIRAQLPLQVVAAVTQLAKH